MEGDGGGGKQEKTPIDNHYRNPYGTIYWENIYYA